MRGDLSEGRGEPFKPLEEKHPRIIGEQINAVLTGHSSAESAGLRA